VDICPYISPASFLSISESIAFRFISSNRSIRPRMNLGWENSHTWFSVAPRWPLGVLFILWKPYLSVSNGVSIDKQINWRSFSFSTYILSCRTNEEKLLCLKCFGKTSLANSATLHTMNDVPL
jgi:hypothetical protein